MLSERDNQLHHVPDEERKQQGASVVPRCRPSPGPARSRRWSVVARVFSFKFFPPVIHLSAPGPVPSLFAEAAECNLMQSSWQRIAREAFRCSATRRLTPATSLPTPRTAFPRLCQDTWPTSTGSPFSAWRRTLATSALSFQQAPTSTASRPLEEPTPSTKGDDAPDTSPARQASVAARAIRFSVGSGNLPDAYLILNSIYYAKRDHSSLLDGIARILPQNAFKPTPIPFSPETPTRLVTHTLLHSLLKNGYRFEASRLMAEFMKNEIHISNRSLGAVYHGLANPNLARDDVPPPKPGIGKVNILKSNIPEELVGSHEAKHALRLLNIARESRRKRSATLYHTLIRLCIFNGEIILASLIFGLLVRDWNACVVDQDLVMTNGTSSSTSQEVVEGPTMEATQGRNQPSPFPKERTLCIILNAIKYVLKVQDPRARHYEEGALQALANLAMLLDHRLLAPSSSSLIYLLSRIELGQLRRGGQTVWVSHDGEMQEVDAEAYFDDVLTRMCKNPPSISYPPSSLVAPISLNGGYMPALEVAGYEHLAYFALAKQQSYGLAKSLVDHMRLERSTPWNVSKLILERFKQAAVTTGDPQFLKAAEFLASSNMSDPLPSLDTDDLSAGPEITDVGQHVFSEAIQSNNVEQIRSHLDVLTKTQRKDAIPDFLDLLIPGYYWRDLDKDVAAHYSLRGTRLLGAFQNERPQEQFEKDIRAAIANGPKVITTVLAALKQSCEFHAADRVWVWAKQMERYSWMLTENDYAYKDELRPWTLPISAYTTILQIRAIEMTRSVKNPDAPWARPTSVIRRSAMRIYDQAMRAHRVYNPLVRRAKRLGIGVHHDHELAFPDSVFFNAILDILCAEESWPTVRPSSQTAPQAAEELKRAMRFYAEERGPLHDIDKPLLRIGKDLLEHGYPIPLGLRYLFVGHGLDPARNDIDSDLWETPVHRLPSALKKRVGL